MKMLSGLGLVCPLVLSGPIQDEAATAVATDGWTRLFDGATLEGWTTTGGPYDGQAEWAVEQGVIVGREGPNRAGGLLYTEELYADFEIELDAWISYPFDSGIFARMLPGKRGAQVTLDYRPGGEIGGIYSNAWLLHNPAGEQAWKRDQWNKVRVWCAGNPMVLRAWVNEVLVSDYRLPRGAGDFARNGRIGLQVHGGGEVSEDAHARFRDIRVRRLPAGAGEVFQTDASGHLGLTAAGEAMGWRSLFNGRDMTGWEALGDGSGYRIRDRQLEFLYEGSSPYLRTRKDYQNFHLRMDFRIGTMANSGLFLRGDREGSDPAFSGTEIQILDDFHWEERTGTKLEPFQFSGGLYGAVAPGNRNALLPLGEWNTYDVIYRGSRIAAYLNGRLLYDLDTLVLEPAQGKAFGERASRGFIGLQRHAPASAGDGESYAGFRNLFLREL